MNCLGLLWLLSWIALDCSSFQQPWSSSGATAFSSSSPLFLRTHQQHQSDRRGNGMHAYGYRWHQSRTFLLGLSSPSTSSSSNPSTDDSAEQQQPNRQERKSLLELLQPSPDAEPHRMSGTDLAYIGDSVFELFIRSRQVWPPKRTSVLQDEVVSLVRAEHQSTILARLQKEFVLSGPEKQIMMRGRNAVTKSKHRRNPAAYQDSTALECLVGYLFMKDTNRCEDLLCWLEGQIVKEEEEAKKNE